MRVLVTGANGFLGQGVVRHLLNLNQEVIAADFSVDGIDDRAQKMPCDLFSIVGEPYVCFGEPDIILHLAWRDGFVHYSNAHIEDLPSHYRFLESFSQSSVKKIVVMGSMHEIGFFEGSINEDTPCNPTTPYGISKNALRGLTAMLCQRNDKLFQWLRGFYIVSNSKYGSSIFSKLTAAESEDKELFPFTLGLNQFDFIDYEDFCERVARTVIQDSVLGIINICSGRPEKLSDRVERFIRENNFSIRLEYGAFPDRPYDSKAVWGDSSKIEKIMSML